MSTSRDFDIITALSITFGCPMPMLNLGDAQRLKNAMVASGHFVDVEIDDRSSSHITLSGFETAWVRKFSPQEVLASRFGIITALVRDAGLVGIIKTMNWN